MSALTMYGIPNYVQEFDNNHKKDPSKSGLVLVGTTTTGNNWEHVSIKDSESLPSKRIKYKSRQSNGVEMGLQDESCFQYTLNVNKAEYDVKVDGNDDSVMENGFMIHRNYICRNEISGIKPFVKVGWGVLTQRYEKTEFPYDHTNADGTVGVKTTNKLGGPCFDLTVGGTQSFFDERLSLMFGAQYLRWGVNIGSSILMGADALQWGGIDQYNLLFSLAYKF